MTRDSDPLAVGKRLLAALEADDADEMRACCAPDVVFWNNLDAERGIDEVVTLHEAERRHVPDLHFEDVRLRPTDTGYVQQATIRGTTVRGDDVRIPLCAVVAVDNGRITRLEEYVSISHVRPILEAMATDR